MAPQDLHTLLTAARDDAPPPRLSVDDITAAGRQLVRRRRRLALVSSVAGGAVAVAAAITSVLVMTAPPAMTPALDPSGLPGQASPALTEFADAPAFTTTYQGYAAGKYTVSDPDVVTTAYQQSTIAVTQAPAVPSGSAASPASLASAEAAKTRTTNLLRGGMLVVYRDGAFDPREFQPAEKVPLRNGGSGLLHYAGRQEAPTVSAEVLQKSGKPGIAVPALAWQYSGDAWAAIYWSAWETTPQRDELLAIADGLAPAQPKAFPVGFRLKSVPRGYLLASASFGQDLLTGEPAASAVRLTLKPPQLPLTGAIDFDELSVLTLSVGPFVPGVDPALGKPACSDGGLICTQVANDRTAFARVQVTSVKQLPGGQSTQIVLGMIPGDPNNRAAWPSVTEVFPQ